MHAPESGRNSTTRTIALYKYNPPDELWRGKNGNLSADPRSLLVHRSAAAACRDGGRRWRTRTLTSSAYRTTRPRLGSVFTVSTPPEMSKSVRLFTLQLFLDGHGGSIVAKYASKHLHKFIIQRPEFPNDIPEALKQVSEREIIKRLYS